MADDQFDLINTGTPLQPRSLKDVLDADGDVDPVALRLYQQRKRRERGEEEEELIDQLINEADEEMTNDFQYQSRKKRSTNRKTLLTRNDKGDLVPLTWQRSSWYGLYLSEGAAQIRNPSKHFRKKFRRRFRMPYSSFFEFAAFAEESIYFNRWKGKDALGVPATPLPLLLLGALRYLGRGWTFDDLEESTGINEETHRQFFHVFIKWGSCELYDAYVVLPRTSDEFKEQSAEYESAGMNGCVGSTDATHIAMEKCNSWLAQTHSGSKLSLPSRTYNVTVNHRRKVLSSTKGHPARWNDKTLQLHDQLLQKLIERRILDDNTFTLCERMPSGDIVEANYRGAWLVVDNGYLHWPVTIPPFKGDEYRKETRWSQWLESMRKDVECAFGIIKGRFRILKTGIRLHGVETCDRIWLTCLALHNMLLEIDGLNDRWESLSVQEQSIWNGELGQHDSPTRNFAISRLFQTSGGDMFSNFDVSGIGRADGDEAIQDGRGTRGGKIHAVGDKALRVVAELDFDYFRGRLVEHFDIAFEKHSLEWPKRNGTQQTTI